MIFSDKSSHQCLTLSLKIVFLEMITKKISDGIVYESLVNQTEIMAE